jgi:hypothetical protein
MLHGYFDGSHRSLYVRAVTYLVLAIAIAVTFRSFYDPFAIMASRYPNLKESPSADIYFLFFNYIEYWLYAMVPLLSLGTMLYFMFWKLSFIEHLVLNSFISAQILLWETLLTFVEFVIEPTETNITFIMILSGMTFAYTIWVYMQMSWTFRADHRTENIPILRDGPIVRVALKLAFSIRLIVKNVFAILSYFVRAVMACVFAIFLVQVLFLIISNFDVMKLGVD